ncbi:MAG TPA: TetR/AcrR family transcriptional regulator [Sorangium sp.]|uniref:TetR family transcriptional regulator n=1 Tax=Sorangium cellulosum TaxID=56 RepID=A0A150S979_SORCE|nr:TetR family transcriptional regulator [Sorangium cellulosum]HTN83262.1 TetR/AcrR family transcriptional regulator [Sorangium sp.]
MNAFTQKPGRRDAQKDATRARILETARDHFERHGFEAASVRAIAADAGVAAGTVLLHFEDKRALLHAALFDDLAATAAEAVRDEEPGTLEERLHRLAAAFFGYYARRPALSKTLLRESLFADPPWQARFAEQVAVAHGRVAALFEAARARGEVAEGADAALFGVAFFSFYYFALIAWVQGAHPAPVALLDRLVAQHLCGLRPADHPGRSR